MKDLVRQMGHQAKVWKMGIFIDLMNKWFFLEVWGTNHHNHIRRYLTVILLKVSISKLPVMC